ncbi:centromere protein S [Discoglossus pictus]
MAENSEEQQLSQTQRLKAAVHYTVGCLCQEVAGDEDIQFSKQAVAAISEITFRQSEIFAKDLEMFARHAKRTTINMEDVKLLARRSRSLQVHIAKCSEEIASINQEQKRKKKSASAGKRHGSSEGDTTVPDGVDNNTA